MCAFRPFHEPTGNGSNRAISPVRKPAGEWLLFAPSRRLESTLAGHCGSRPWTSKLGGSAPRQSPREGPESAAIRVSKPLPLVHIASWSE
jgi:hypothetical protein